MQSSRAMKAFSSGAVRPGVARSRVIAKARVESRRQLLTSTALAAATAAVLPAEAKGLKGFQTRRDTGDGYEFAFPFGWQEVSINGVDAVYKDVIEPLESVSVQLVATDKKSITEYGPANEIAGTLANSVLTSGNDSIKLIKSEREVSEGRDYVAFEFLALSGRFTRHVVAAATVANGKLMLFTIGSSEKRWSKMEEKLTSSVKSFKAFEVFA